MNYADYLTANVFDYIKAKISAVADDELRFELVCNFVDILTSKFLDECSDLWKHNNSVVKTLSIQKNIK
jgi:hypothetical protein